MPFTYFEYIVIDSVYPLLGSENGGTPLTLEARNVVQDQALYEQPFKCRFSFEYAHSDTIQAYLTDAVIVSSREDYTVVSCPTPDASARVDASANNYTDVFVTLSEIDGQFRQDSQIRFTFVGHIAL